MIMQQKRAIRKCFALKRQCFIKLWSCAYFV